MTRTTTLYLRWALSLLVLVVCLPSPSSAQMSDPNTDPVIWRIELLDIVNTSSMQSRLEGELVGSHSTQRSACTRTPALTVAFTACCCCTG